MHRVLTKQRLAAIIDALTEALAGEVDDRKVYEGALDWANYRMTKVYNIKEDTVIWDATKHLPDSISLMDVLGLIPQFLSSEDPRPAAEQIGEFYIGGWRPMPSFTLLPDSHGLHYPGDPVMYPLAETHLRDETILVYQYGWTLILQPEGAFEVARLD